MEFIEPEFGEVYEWKEYVPEGAIPLTSVLNNTAMQNILDGYQQASIEQINQPSYFSKWIAAVPPVVLTRRQKIRNRIYRRKARIMSAIHHRMFPDGRYCDEWDY